MNGRDLSRIYRQAHNRMRDVEGLLPQEAFDELLKFLFFKDSIENRESRHQGDGELSARIPEEIREIFSTDLVARAPWALQLWRDGRIHLSDRTLVDIQALFSGVTLRQLPLDVRGVALRSFLSSGVRKGLGVFLTPEDVVRMMVKVVGPASTDVVLDPACGSGTFLMEAAQFVATQGSRDAPFVVYGVDKNPRMLMLASLNFGHLTEFDFRPACADSLRDLGQGTRSPLGMRSNSVDIILTNPPFGVSVTEDTGVLDLFGRSSDWAATGRRRVPSEVLFVDLCLRLLRPGGRLGIVLPRSVFTNERLCGQRRMIDGKGHLTDLVDLPQETFSSMGTQTATVAAFFCKKGQGERPSPVSVRVCHVTNVGFDFTGRRREGNQLPDVAARLAAGEEDGDPIVTTHEGVDATETLQRAARLLFRRNGGRRGIPLQEFVEEANKGRTPSRERYTDSGMFILKVGNLTGRGIDWEPRERNFVSRSEGAKRARNERLSVRKGDILLTSSAHAARYIAKKVDVVNSIPGVYSGVSFVGELIRIRPVSGVDPFVLLAALRQRGVREDLQASVRGQTAHLSPRDLLEVGVPCDLRSPPDLLLEVAALLRREAELAFRLSSVSLEAQQLLESSVPTAV